MTKYIKNKDFIPEKFYDKKEANNKIAEKRVIYLFLIMNLFLLPFTAENIMKIEEKPAENTYNMNSIKHNIIDIKDINIWVQSLINNNIDEASINNNSGEILVSDFDKITELSNNSQIRINKVDLNNNNEYKLEVSLNE